MTDGIIPFDPARYGPILENIHAPLDIGNQLTVNMAIKKMSEMLEMVKMMSLIGSGVQERLISAMDSLCEMTQDFTDSAFTPHQKREQILDYLDECRYELNTFELLKVNFYNFMAC